LRVPFADLVLRRAVSADLEALVRLYSIPGDGNKRDENPTRPIDPAYAEALALVAADPNNMLMVADAAGRIAGALHVTFLQYVVYRGGRVALIENVIVDPELRGQGVGEAMMRWAIDAARRRGCFRVQLTSSKTREKAHRFYERLGFARSHEGFTMALG
jgi:GNAT superfamily N-acetyltransferase